MNVRGDIVEVVVVAPHPGEKISVVVLKLEVQFLINIMSNSLTWFLWVSPDPDGELNGKQLKLNGEQLTLI